MPRPWTYVKEIDWDVVSECLEQRKNWTEIAQRLFIRTGVKITPQQLKSRWIDRYRYNLDDDYPLIPIKPKK